MSRPRDDKDASDVPSWFAGNGLWSPSTPSSSHSVADSHGSPSQTAGATGPALREHNSAERDDGEEVNGDDDSGRGADKVEESTKNEGCGSSNDDDDDALHDVAPRTPSLSAPPQLKEMSDALLSPCDTTGIDETHALSAAAATIGDADQLRNGLEPTATVRNLTHQEDVQEGNTNEPVDSLLEGSQQPQQGTGASSLSASQQEWIATASVSINDTVADAKTHEPFDDPTPREFEVDTRTPRCASTPPVLRASDGADPTKAASSSSSRASSSRPPPPAEQRATASSVESVVEWVSCRHSDAPARYRDTPAYYCTYCSYTVCEACYALIPTPQQQPPRQKAEMDALLVETNEENVMAHESNTVETVTRQRNACPASTGMNWLDDVLNSPSTAVRSGVHGTAAATTTTAATRDESSAAHARHPRPHRALFASTAATSATPTQSKPISNGDHHKPIIRTTTALCHLCRRGHLRREEALLHEWCCEGPAPEKRRYGGHALVYDTQNLQKYHFMRAQHESRLASTAPLQAQVLSACPAVLQPDGIDSPHSALRQTRVQRAENVRRDPLPTPNASTTPHTHQQGGFPHRPTRRTAAAAATAAIADDSLRALRAGHDGDGSTHSHSRHRRGVTSTLPTSSSSSPSGQSCACEEGGSFVFSVRNPRLETTLVWCAVNRQPREEAPAYASAAAATVNVIGGSPLVTSVTPLLLWKCPPSLPGLPARPYRVGIPYGLYAFANVHALTLYMAGDIFRKASTQLVGSPSVNNSGGNKRAVGGWVEGGRGDGLLFGGVDGSALLSQPQQQQRLVSMMVAPAASLRPLLTVTVLHHVATTPRPLPFPFPQEATSATITTTPTVRKRSCASDAADDRAEKVSRPETQPAVESPLENGKEEKGKRMSSPFPSQLSWPDGLASPELALCVDHLLQGRSVAVYGIASKFFFLQHVASSAALQPFHVVTVDASRGRARASGGGRGAVSGGTKRGAASVAVSGSGSGTSAATSSSTTTSGSVQHQLLSLGHALLRRVASSNVLTAEGRAAMTAAAATAAKGKANEKSGPPHHARLTFRDDDDGVADADTDSERDARTAAGEEAQVDGCGAGREVARAALHGDVGRSPAVARDVTAAMRHTVEVVDVDSSSSFNAEEDEDTRAASVRAASGTTPIKGTVREALVLAAQTPPPTASASTTAATTVVVSPQDARVLSGGTPLSQRLTTITAAATTTQPGGVDREGERGLLTQLESPSQARASSTLTGMSPIPAFFEALQRTVTGDEKLNDDSVSQHGKTNPMRDLSQRDTDTTSTGRTVSCEELPEFFGEPTFSRVPPLQQPQSEDTVGTGSGTGRAVTELRWRPPVVLYANDAVRRHVLQHLRRRHVGRRCVQWAALPSVTTVVQLEEQRQQQQQQTTTPSTKSTNTHTTASSFGFDQLPRTLLTNAHQTRPGWQPPVLLVLHNVDLLDGDEVSILLQLCAQFAFPQPHLQLLLSFDDPHWPLSPVAAALTRLGVCAVQLRSLLLPRVHEMRHESSIHLLTDFEAAAAAGGGVGSGGRGHARSGLSSSLASGGGGGGGAAAFTGVNSAGTSHLLQDTIRRVLFSLPPAFNSLLRILLDVQDEVGDGVYVSLFTVTERFERSGVMVSQGRLKALLRELTSNRIARYDPAEHALMVPQVARLRKVLEEVTAQRERGRGGPAT